MSELASDLPDPVFFGNPIRLNGNGLAWRDMITSLFGRRLSSPAGGVTYNYEDNAITFASGGVITNADDRIGGNQEINHQFLVGANIELFPHIHFWQSSALNYEFTLRWRLQRNGQARVTDWQTQLITVNDGNDAFPYVSGTLNQITRTPLPITVTCGISDTIQFQLARTDALGGTVEAFFFDIHGKVDGFGSDREALKDD